MMISERLQHLIHTLEVGRFSRWLQLLPLALAVMGLTVLYDLNSYRGFNSPEAMDAAQVARNVAEGKGYTTDFIRPFSVFLVQKHNREILAGETQMTNTADFANLNGRHPDLANPPVYPTVLAGMIKLWNPEWKVETRKPFWAENGRFLRYPPEFRIALLNQALLLVVVVLTFFLTKKLLDAPAAWLAAILTLGADGLWKFSVSGQATLLLLVIFMGLVWCLMKIEELGRADVPPPQKLFGLAITAGVLVGAGMLTRYAFGWVIVPVAVFMTLFGGRRRPGLAVAAFLAFGLAVAPWLIRNLSVSGTLFGTAGYAVVEGTYAFPGSRLMQSVNPDMTGLCGIRPYLGKFLGNTRNILQNDLLRVGGGWVAVLFFAGLLLGLRNTAARRLRYFTLMCLAVLVIAQALGRTQLSASSPEINSENLLVLLTPLVVIFGVAFFLTLLNQMQTPAPPVRLAVIVLMVLVACQSFITNLLPPKISPVAWPPYNPPEIQRLSGWMGPDELMMSDVPWAVAWYGRHQCVWLTLDAQDEFYALHKNLKPVSALYLTSLTMDGKFVSEWFESNRHSWGRFLYGALKDERLPDNFPLTKMPEGLFPERLFLSNRDRWSAPK
jgi:4-amino-4-deoxy-L-arabinose transferase-like glycosyltransferase